VVLNLKNGSIDLPFQLGQGTAIIVEPKSAATNGTQPVGTGPYKLETWNKGSSVVLSRWDAYRNAKDVKLRRVTIRFISDPAAQVAALLSGDVDVFPRVAAARSLKQFEEQQEVPGADRRHARQGHPGHQQQAQAAGQRAGAPRDLRRHRPQGRDRRRGRRLRRAHRQLLHTGRAGLCGHHGPTSSTRPRRARCCTRPASRRRWS
jgi:MarR-like DNA-binding transcriptional regulator SgrR of sgrS sRNA